MPETRKFFGALLAVIGLALLVAPAFMLDSSATADGTDRVDLAALVQALGAVAGGVVSLIFAWYLIRRR